MDNIDTLISSLNSLLAKPEFMSFMLGHLKVYRGRIGFFRCEGDRIGVGYPDVDPCADTWEPESKWASADIEGLVLEFVRSKDAELYNQAVALM